MTTPLVPCPQCKRHVFTTDDACPFCASTLPNDLALRAIPSTAKRLTRAATFAFTASLSVVACSSSGTTGPAADSGSDTGAVTPIYGAPVDGGFVPDAHDGGGVAPLYGAPADAGTDTGSGGVLYGLPPADASNG